MTKTLIENQEKHDDSGEASIDDNVVIVTDGGDGITYVDTIISDGVPTEVMAALIDILTK